VHDRLGCRLAAGQDGVYGVRMVSALKTTVYLDPKQYERIKEIARSESRAPAELLREAVAEYAARKRPQRKPRSLGIGHSQKGDVSARAEELLTGIGRRK